MVAATVLESLVQEIIKVVVDDLVRLLVRPASAAANRWAALAVTTRAVSSRSAIVIVVLVG